MNYLIKIFALAAIIFSLTACKTTQKKENKTLTDFNKTITKKNKTLSKSKRKEECQVSKIIHDDSTTQAVKMIKKRLKPNKNYHHSLKKVIENWTSFALKNAPRAEIKKYNNLRMMTVMNYHFSKGLNCPWLKNVKPIKTKLR